MHATRRRSWMLALTAAALLAAGAVLARGAPAGHAGSPFRYRFERPPQGAITNLLRAEIAFYEDRLARNPDGALDRAGLAGAYLKEARVTGDIRWYLLADQTARASLARLNVNNEGAILALARVAEARHDFADAMRLARAAGPSGEALPIIVTSNLARGDVPAASRAVRALMAADPSLRAYALRALVEIAQGRDAEAEADYRRALALEEPEETASSTWVRSLYGRFLYQHGRFDEARALFTEALRILPQYPLALTDLAVLELRQGWYEAAVDHLTRVVTVTRDAPNVYDHVVLRGVAQARDFEGRHAEAARFWADAETRLRQDAASGAYGHRRELARLLLTRGRAADLPEALRLMRQELAVRMDPDTLDTMAWALCLAGRWDEAQRAERAAMRWGVRDARYFYRAALIAQQLGDTEAARGYLRRVRAADPAFDARSLQVALVGL
ncbi:MAG TPA: tetratricopeptide repeat protein [bacterium]|nr:tetratricopeptide repeat protein [bacterium]